MGIWDTIGRLEKIAEDPNLADAALAIGKTAHALPNLLISIDKSLNVLVIGQGDMFNLAQRIESLLTGISGTLVEISIGLDAVADPVKRPPFSSADIEAVWKGEWPEKAASSNILNDREAPLDCTNLMIDPRET